MTSGLASLVRDEQRAAAEATLILAFAEDPVQRWLYPAAETYLERFPLFLSETSAAAYESGGVWQLHDSAAVAIWMPPDAHEDDDVLVSSLMQTVDSSKHADLMRMLDQMSDLQPAGSHWHLPWFGVDPVQQGRGLGQKLMSACLHEIDAKSQAAYLESTNPRNLPFYERLGFTVRGHINVPGCPPMIAMLRNAR
jgi:ribosomal protein S18 acetylase RimI-like enzyme